METLTLVTKLSQLEELVEKASKSKYIAVDTETNGLKRFSVAIGVSLSFSANDGYYIPVQVWKDNALVNPWSESAYIEVQKTLETILLHSKRLITHNGAFDAKIIKNTFNIDIIDLIYSDTQLLHHTCIDEGDSHALKKLAVKFLTPDADSPQQDLKDSVIANGGRWVKGEKDFYKGDWKLLGIYACWDTIYTYRLFEMWQGEIEKQGLETLWYEEVMPMLKVTYELNTTGLRVDLPYFEKLKSDMEQRVAALQDEVYAMIKDQVEDYEINKLLESVTLTKRSEVGKLLISKGYDVENPTKEALKIVYAWFTSKKQMRTVFNLDSGDDKAYLIYDVLGIPCTEFTASGKRSTAKSLMDKLAEENADKAEVLKLLRERSKELKLLNTYVLTVLETHEHGRIYPNFMQTGTTSGRYSCGGNSLNLQTLPANDSRIKAGFIPDEDTAFIEADYSSLEPRAFASVSNEKRIQESFNRGHDFYSTIAIDVLGLTGVSADPDDPRYLGTVDKAKRQWVKGIALSIPYGAQAGRLSQMMGISYEEGQEVYNKYIDAYPQLKAWMDRSVYDMKTKGYVTGITGRKKRGPIVAELYNKYKIRDFSKKGLARAFPILPVYEGVADSNQLYLECRNLFNVARNHQVQSLAASICNQAMIDLTKRFEEQGMIAKLCLQVHDSITVLAPKAEAELASKLLQEHMENNAITKLITVKMIAKPVITEVSLADTK